MALSVVIRSGETETSPSITFDTPRIVLGRSEGCDVHLPDPTISHRHASLRQRGTDYIIVDEASTNGTFVGPVRLPPHTPRVVRTGDLVRLGRVWVELRVEQVLPTAQPNQATREIALALVANALAAEGGASVVTVQVTEGPDAGKVLELPDFERSYVLGRGGNVALQFDDPDVSRRHIELIRRGAKLLVRELGSKNGAELAGEPLTPDRQVPWKRHTTLRFGGSALTYDDPVADALMDIERAADERMGDDESVEPPTSVEKPGRPSEPPPPDNLRPSGPEAGRAQPSPGVRKRAPHRPQRRGWSGTDYVVALLALSVLTLSILAFMWLLGSE